MLLENIKRLVVDIAVLDGNKTGLVVSVNKLSVEGGTARYGERLGAGHQGPQGVWRGCGRPYYWPSQGDQVRQGLGCRGSV